MDYNQRVHGIEKANFTKTIESLQKTQTDSLLQIKNLQDENRSLRQQLESRRMDPSSIGIKCNHIESDLRSLMSNIEKVNTENMVQDQVIKSQFTQ